MQNRELKGYPLLGMGATGVYRFLNALRLLSYYIVSEDITWRFMKQYRVIECEP
jgi:hypothetical protein